MSEKKHRMAIAYDFDGTLAKGNIQEDSFIPKLGLSKKQFWTEAKEIAKTNDMDEILAYMYLLIRKAKEKDVEFNKNNIESYGKSVHYFDGVEDFFERISAYAKEKNITLDHYIISSGTKEMIEGTSIAKKFKYIFASSYKYDKNHVPEWPAIAINYTAKIQYLFRINKGIDKVWDNSKINEYTPEDERPVPFEHMIYIGDGETDIPAMKMLNYQGGVSIAVYPPDNRKAKEKTEKLLIQKRASYISVADYSDGQGIDDIVKRVIDQISAKTSIQKYSKTNKKSKKRNSR